MKLMMMVLLLLAAFCQAADVKESTRSTQKSEERNIKRALVEGNTGVDKRATVLPTARTSVTPGIEYAAKDSQADKSPAQQIYATPVPQIAKFSDVLTGQGPAFQAAIASHLYSPVSVYQPRLSSPTTYELSPPIPSNLAYSEKISYQPNTLQSAQYTSQEYNQKQPQRPLARLAVPQQQILVQPVYQQQQPNLQIYQIPQNPQVYQVQLPYNQYPQGFQAYPQNVQQVYAQPLAQPQHNVQPEIVYAKEELQREQLQQPIQREQKISQPLVTKTLEKQTPSEPNTQSQAAISYASFSQSQPTPSYVQQQFQSQTQFQPQSQAQNHYQAQSQHQAQNHHQARLQAQHHAQSQPQYLIQAQPHQQAQNQQFSYQSESQNQYQSQQAQPQYQTQPQPQIRVHLVQSQPQYQLQPQQQYQRLTQIQFQNPQPQYTKLEPSPANSLSSTVKYAPDVQYFRPGLVHIQAASSVQPQYFQPQVYASPEGLAQNSGYGALAVAPTFPLVQYFGKFAQAIFGGQHQ